MRRILEKIGPLSIGGCITILLILNKIDWLSSENFTDALNAGITFTSIIIGLLGAVFPIILSAKDNSPFIKFVFKHDRDKLLFKYISRTYRCGFVFVLYSMLLFFSESFNTTCVYQYFFGIWVGLLITMLCSAWRCIYFILKLIMNMDESIPESNTRVNNHHREESQEIKDARNKILKY